MVRRLASVLLLSLLLAPIAVLADEVTVEVGHARLEPAELTVSAGTTVVFHNVDQMPGGHTIVADDGSFESPGLGKDEKWSHTFEEPGTFAYHIKEHSSAKGTIIVE